MPSHRAALSTSTLQECCANNGWNVSSTPGRPDHQTKAQLPQADLARPSAARPWLHCAVSLLCLPYSTWIGGNWITTCPPHMMCVSCGLAIFLVLDLASSLLLLLCSNFAYAGAHQGCVRTFCVYQRVVVGSRLAVSIHFTIETSSDCKCAQHPSMLIGICRAVVCMALY